MEASVRDVLPPDDEPALVVRENELAGADPSPATMRTIPGSRMFEIGDGLKVYRNLHPEAEVFDASQGDGGASLPGVGEGLLDEAHRLQKEHGTAYDKPFGTELFRRAVVEDYWGLDAATGWGPANIIACQGGRDALIKAYEAMQYLGHGRRGDFVLTTRVPWISYNWGPYSVGANVMLAPGSEADAWELTPDGIRASVAAARGLGRHLAGVVITSPDNPTGRTKDPDAQLELVRASLSAGVPFVLLDWIYHRVSDEAANDLNRFLTSLDEGERERVMILDGITKSLGASNVRNAHLVAATRVVKLIQSRASHGVIPSFHSQAVAVAAYRMGFDRAAAAIVEPTNASRKVLGHFLADKGIRHILGKGYYAFLDVGRWIDEAGLEDSAALGAHLAEAFGIAVVPGVYFSQFGARWIRFSYALPPAVTAGAAERLWYALETLARQGTARA